ncbi:MAG TPA: succinylglutamate desuccinylase/aspartoacylase family protein [Planctomycetota bacterium]|nr:succinylglutamate desuccinylase/aspartoacylase family protein [Planctomycetota bacterium]
MTTRSVVNAEQLDFDTPGRRDYHVKLEHTTIWAHHLIPITVIVGPNAKPGRGLVAIGSTHGDELEGPVAVKHLLREIRTDDVPGRIILIPVLNPMAFKANRRETPDDGVNFNRAFPGDPKGSVTVRLADMVTRFIFPQVHVVLDIHAGGEAARFPATSNVHLMKDPVQRKAMEETARGFGTKFIMQYQNVTPGLLTGLAEDLGKISVDTEMGWGRAVQAAGVSMSRQGVLTPAVRQGQLRGDPPANRHYAPSEQRLVDTSHPDSHRLAAFEGHFEPLVGLGQAVKTGRRVGWLHDFNRLDDPPMELPAPHDGDILGQAWGAKVIQGQGITQVGKPVEWAR